jgi:DNA polymerase-1
MTDDQRLGAKPVNFGAIYGMGPLTLVQYAFATYGVILSLAQAAQYLDRFFATYPGLKEYLKEHAKLCQCRGYIEIGVGRVLEDRWEEFGISYQQCCNIPVQGIAADCMLRALILVYHALEQAGIPGKIIASIHDEIIIEVPEFDAEEARDLLQQCMIEAFVKTFPHAPNDGVATAKIGQTWADLK